MASTKDMMVFPGVISRGVLLRGKRIGRRRSISQRRPGLVRNCARGAGTHNHRRWFCEERRPPRLNRERNAVWVPACAGTTLEYCVPLARCAPLPPRSGGEGVGGGGASANSPLAARAERPPTPDPSPPRAMRVGGGEKNYTDAVVTPPSRMIICPVMKLEASEPR